MIPKSRADGPPRYPAASLRSFLLFTGPDALHFFSFLRPHLCPSLFIFTYSSCVQRSPSAARCLGVHSGHCHVRFPSPCRTTTHVRRWCSTHPPHSCDSHSALVSHDVPPAALMRTGAQLHRGCSHHISTPPVPHATFSLPADLALATSTAPEHSRTTRSRPGHL